MRLTIFHIPYERELSLWRSDRERRGENNITNFSNELDVEHNVWDDHNNGSSGEGVQNGEKEDQG